MGDEIAHPLASGDLSERSDEVLIRSSFTVRSADAHVLWSRIASHCENFGHHLEQAAWQQGVIEAPRMAFVADGAAVNWTIHKADFSQMTGTLDLMHALSDAWKAAKVLDDLAAYERYAS